MATCCCCREHPAATFEPPPFCDACLDRAGELRVGDHCFCTAANYSGGVVEIEDALAVVTDDQDPDDLIWLPLVELVSDPH